MRRLLLARHGQSVSNAVRRFQGAQDVALSPLGRRQAEALGRRAGPAPHRRRLREPAGARPPHRGDRGGRPRPPAHGAWTICASCRWASGRAARWRRSGRGPAIPMPAGCAIRCECLPPGGEPLADVQARVVRAVGRDRARAPERRRRAGGLPRRGDQRAISPTAWACRCRPSGGSRSRTARSPSWRRRACSR